MDAIDPILAGDPIYIIVGKSDKPLKNSTFVEDGKLNYVTNVTSYATKKDAKNVKFTVYKDNVELPYLKFTFENKIDDILMFEEGPGDFILMVYYLNGDAVESINISMDNIKVEEDM